MYIHKDERARLDAIVEAALAVTAQDALKGCADVAVVLEEVRQDSRCPRDLLPPQDAVEALHALGLEPEAQAQVSAVLHWTVASLALQPWLSRLDVLTWFARQAPDALLVLLGVLAEDPSITRSPEHPNRSTVT